MLAIAGAIAISASSVLARPDPSTSHLRVVGYGQTRFDGLGPEAWAQRARYWQRAFLRERRELLSSRTVTEAIDLACATYGWCSTLWRKARCETGGTFSPTAYNPSGASGLFQFLPSTWATTPYRSLSIWSPYANALAAGWMHANGRGGEWACS
jgi:hypothetical protein